MDYLVKNDIERIPGRNTDRYLENLSSMKIFERQNSGTFST